jgi:hypothetical protein
MSETVQETGECESCGWQALVTYVIERNGAGEVVLKYPRETRCTNPECENYTAPSNVRRTDDAAPSKRRMTKRQRDAFARREGEDAYEWTARTHRTLPFRDLPRVLMMRSEDRKQVEAIQLLAQLKMVQWTRALTYGTLVLGVCTIVAAVIVRS